MVPVSRDCPPVTFQRTDGLLYLSQTPEYPILYKIMAFDKIIIIGAGRMGGAIAAGLHNSHMVDSLIVVNRSEDRLRSIKEKCIKCSTCLSDILEADSKENSPRPTLIILALRFEAMEEVFRTILSCGRKNIVLASLSPLTSLAYLRHSMENTGCPVLRIMPNIGITRGESMTFICADSKKDGIAEEVQKLFSTMGKAAVIPESLFPAATALASCGLAYALRYIRACMQSGALMGMEPGDACDFTLQTLRGAVALLEGGTVHPEEALDDVMTPGGLTVKGVTALDKNGFTGAVTAAFEASFKPENK